MSNEYRVGTTDKTKIWVCVMDDPYDGNLFRARFTNFHEQLVRIESDVWPSFPSSLGNTEVYEPGANVPYIQIKG